MALWEVATKNDGREGFMDGCCEVVDVMIVWCVHAGEKDPFVWRVSCQVAVEMAVEMRGWVDIDDLNLVFDGIQERK